MSVTTVVIISEAWHVLCASYIVRGRCVGIAEYGRGAVSTVPGVPRGGSTISARGHKTHEHRHTIIITPPLLRLSHPLSLPLGLATVPRSLYDPARPARRLGPPESDLQLSQDEKALEGPERRGVRPEAVGGARGWESGSSSPEGVCVCETAAYVAGGVSRPPWGCFSPGSEEGRVGHVGVWSM